MRKRTKTLFHILFLSWVPRLQSTLRDLWQSTGSTRGPGAAKKTAVLSGCGLWTLSGIEGGAAGAESVVYSTLASTGQHPVSGHVEKAVAQLLHLHEHSSKVWILGIFV